MKDYCGKCKVFKVDSRRPELTICGGCRLVYYCVRPITSLGSTVYFLTVHDRTVNVSVLIGTCIALLALASETLLPNEHARKTMLTSLSERSRWGGNTACVVSPCNPFQAHLASDQLTFLMPYSLKYHDGDKTFWYRNSLRVILKRDRRCRYGLAFDSQYTVPLSEEVVEELATFRANTGGPVARATFSLPIKGTDPPRLQDFDRIYDYRYSVPPYKQGEAEDIIRWISEQCF